MKSQRRVLARCCSDGWRDGDQGVVMTDEHCFPETPIRQDPLRVRYGPDNRLALLVVEPTLELDCHRDRLLIGGEVSEHAHQQTSDMVFRLADNGRPIALDKIRLTRPLHRNVR